ncbi:MAG: hypothetical protein IPL46_01230 [Saprospiraceae bacterium]|nr:hypothetical protein [Saprospiraceae bacterium]
MTIKQTSTIMGLLSISAGLFISVFSFNPSPIIKYVLILMLLGVGAFAIITATTCKKNSVPSLDYWLTGIISLIYAVALILFVDSLSQFLMVTASFVLFFGIINFTFIFSVLNHKPKANLNLILIKGSTGLMAALAGVLILTASVAYSAEVSLMVLGIIKILVGLSFIAVTKYFVLPDLKN